ncbi:MAG: cobaltochelatase subunit CobN [Dehalococcoidia bacterium]|nr:cobaltochelatase subunit CobN [Dehalococcoidia bacterium]MDW8008743.1 cobaltochelatase subunit CobN [Chloroflexota bacterium]
MIVFLTTADTDLQALARALDRLPPDFPPVMARHVRQLASSAALDSFMDAVAPRASLVLLRLLGGKRAFEAGVERLSALCRERHIPLVACPGEATRDPSLEAASTVPAAVVARAYEYLVHGGTENLRQLLLFLSDRLLGTDYGHSPPTPLPWDGVYRPGVAEVLSSPEYRRRYWRGERPAVGVLFYRALWASGNTEAIDVLVQALEERGADVLPVFCYSLRDEATAPGQLPLALRRHLLDDGGRPLVDCIISTLSFALARDDPDVTAHALAALDVPIVQAILATSSRGEWEESAVGVSPLDVAMNVALPELDGRIISLPIAFKEERHDPRLGVTVARTVPDPALVGIVAEQALRWARLRRKPNSKKRVAIVLSNYPTRSARAGNAVGLDTPASAVRLLMAMREAGYRVPEVPEDGDQLMRRLLATGSYDREHLTEEHLAHAPGRVPAEEYRRWFQGLPEALQQEMQGAWGAPPGQVYCAEGALAIPGLVVGNVYLGLQPPRGFGEDPMAVYHSPDLPPTHHYLAFYRWLRDGFGADAVVHLGKHGTLEWLPGKGIGLSPACYPTACLPDLPLLYPFIVNDPGEGAQAKRRAHAVIVDHLMPPMTAAGTYGDLARLEQLMDEYARAQAMDPAKLPLVRRQIWELVERANLHRDLGVEREPDDFDSFLLHVDGYICELKDAIIRGGLHVLGEPPRGEALIDTLLALTRLDNGDVPSLRRSVAEALDIPYHHLRSDLGLPYDGPAPSALASLEMPLRTRGDVLAAVDALCRRLLQALQACGFDATSVASAQESVLGLVHEGVTRTLEHICRRLVPDLERTSDEIGNLLRGLAGGFVPPGPSGSPTRGMANVLPTGRNFYSLDPRSVPSPFAWEVGKALAEGLVQRYLREEGRYPEMVGLVVWGTAVMRTQGDDIAQALALLGVRPRWREEDGRVVGLEVIPLEELGRPRIDVTLRISGFFRDAFPNLIALLDEAIETVATLDEPDEMNYVARHYRQDLARRTASGHAEADARARALYRIFGSKPGTYGAGILAALDEGNWRTEEDLASIYIAWGSYAYSRRSQGESAPLEFREQFARIAVAAKNQDNREHDIFDSDDYLQYHGGMVATVKALTGRRPRAYFGDSSDPSLPRVRDLAEEARRVFRTRVVNPKWIRAMMSHGYKGAFELAATVDYLFGYDATAGVVEDWMYAEVAQAYALDPQMQEFFRRSNPWALRDIAARLLEAASRGLWESPPRDTLDALRRVYLETDALLEEAHEG